MFVSTKTCCLTRRLFVGTLYLYALCCNLCDGICPAECFCLWTGNVNCVGVGLSEIPVEIPTETKMLLLGSNLITTVNEEYFQNIPDVNEIHLDRNLIYEVPLNSFALLSELKTLNMRHNRISSLAADVFQGLGKLQRLDLRSNSITLMDPNSFRGLSNLKVLDLYDNSLRGLPEQIFQGLDALQNVDVGSSRLAAIPTNVFRGLGNLTSITLAENAYLSKLKNGMFVEVPALETLKLQGCPLRDVTAAIFRGLTSLKELHLQNTELHGTVPLGVFENIANLKTLRIDNNHLKSLHESVFSGMVSTGGEVHLQHNDWKCSCGLMTMRARWPAAYTPKIFPSGITCQSPKVWNGRDLWSIPLQDVQAYCLKETPNVDNLNLPTDAREEMLLECGLPEPPQSKLDWITPEGHYILSTTILLNGEFKGDSRYTLLTNGTLMIYRAGPGSYTCTVTEASGESNSKGYRISFSDGLFGSPLSPPKDSDESSVAAVILPTAAIVAVIFVIGALIAWLRCRTREKDDELVPPYTNNKSSDHAYAYAYVSAPEGTKKKRDISAYAIGDLAGFDLPIGMDNKKSQSKKDADKIKPFHAGYDKLRYGKRPKSQSCRERGSKYPTPTPFPRPSHTIDRAGTRGESEIYVTPVNHDAIDLLMPPRAGSGDPDINMGVYGEGQTMVGFKRPLQTQSFNESRPKSNPYMELVA